MTFSDDYVRYPHCRYGIDNDRYDWSSCRAVTLLNGRTTPRSRCGSCRCWNISRWIRRKSLSLRPAVPRRHPDPRVYSSLDYGNRVGAFRVFKALEKYRLKASVALNSSVARRYPFLLNEATRRGWEVLAHGVDMAKLHHGDLNIETERGYVPESLATLREMSGQPVTGWISPARSESMNTLDLVAAECRLCGRLG